MERLRRALLREQSAVFGSLDRQLRNSVLPAPHRGPRAVVGHRSGWFRAQLVTRLRKLDVNVLAAVSDGADALGVAVAEQPDLLFVQDGLPSLPGLDILVAARDLTPMTLLAAQVLSPGAAERFAAVGVDALFTRREAPGDVADRLARCLAAPDTDTGTGTTIATRRTTES